MKKVTFHEYMEKIETKKDAIYKEPEKQKRLRVANEINVNGFVSIAEKSYLKPCFQINSEEIILI